MHQHQAHLKKHLNAIHNCRSIAVAKTFGAIAALEQELATRRDLGEIIF
jgi:hypothetical protein